MKYGHLIAGLFLACTLSTVHASTAQPITATKISSDYAKTQYPIVFAHGMAGFIRVGDVLGLDYWYQILPNLARNGANTWATRVSPFNSTEVRGEQLAQQVEEILAITGSQKVNLIGHSHGGPTSRYVAGIMPNHVASVTAIGSPQRGSPVADIILNAEGTVLEGPVVSLVNLFSKAIVWAQGLDPKSFPHDALAGGKSVTTEGSVLFNRKFPMGVGTTACSEGAYREKGIQFFSFTGNTAVTNLLDLDSALLGTSLLINAGHDNDGLVSRCSAKFGRTIRDNYRWNHLDEINQILGLRALFAPDPVQVYREHANRLKLQGL
ncbi:lipase family alpha/beta hydrolase [Acinetobacter nematophilus]|uniref:Triacylglycerol lipase n=1 Tax=Acinetobacter nematophilus TaxID=2994642 RepID=A0A9X3DTS7_9GAMM|nr:triacylglycerol lipase [Acinetobacter nematophilus]MCX5468364.1 triacylglycerol lipase [Acinetobacter nematophilus]